MIRDKAQHINQCLLSWDAMDVRAKKKPSLRKCEHNIFAVKLRYTKVFLQPSSSNCIYRLDVPYCCCIEPNSMPFFLYLWAYNARNILFAVSCARALIHKGSLWRTHVILKLSYLASTVNFEGKNDLCSNERYFSSSKFKASKKKKDRFVQALNPWPLRYRCSTLPTELISQLEAGH